MLTEIRQTAALAALGRATLTVLLFPFVLLGGLAGLAAGLIRLISGAVVVGYRRAYGALIHGPA